MKQSFKDMAQRVENAESGLLETLVNLGGISRADAVKVAALYKKNKVVRLDVAGSRYHVKHGTFFDRETIRFVSNQPDQPVNQL